MVVMIITRAPQLCPWSFVVVSYLLIIINKFQPLNRKRVLDVPGRYQEDSDDDDEIKQAKTKSLQHEEACVECGGDESLILCAECPSVYHLECHDPPLRHPPRLEVVTFDRTWCLIDYLNMTPSLYSFQSVQNSKSIESLDWWV